MKVLPFDHKTTTSKPFWASKGRFSRYQPDFLIHWFNQLLFLGLAVLTYFCGKRLFDHSVAITAALLLLASEVMWKFSASGLSTILVMVILMAAALCVIAGQQEVLEPKRGSTWPVLMAAIAGVLLGLAGLTRYGTMWLILPAIAFVAVFGGARRVSMALVMAAAFTATFVPWIWRNMGVSGTPLGTASYDLFKGMSLFGEHRLERSLDPDLQFSVQAIWVKFVMNSRAVFQEELFSLGSGWILALFAVALMLGFRKPLIRQTRYWIIGCIVVLYVVQVLGRTQLSEDSPRINTENYLVLLLPLVAIYAAGFFQVMLEQIQVPAEAIRQAVRALLIILVATPLMLTVLPPRTSPIQYPPFYPPTIQHVANWYRADELLMSDVPFAVAWYGDRQCTWLTLGATASASGDDSESFFAINDRIRPIFGVYLTPKTLDQRFQSEIVRGGNDSWGALAVATLLNKTPDGKFEPPRRFPLRTVANELLPEQLFLADWQRWGRTE
jgi:4-amino-4-deoxy-L-arabinose transferase-like glycosyltransferase